MVVFAVVVSGGGFDAVVVAGKNVVVCVDVRDTIVAVVVVADVIFVDSFVV